jgi:hypothetical protein
MNKIILAFFLSLLATSVYSEEFIASGRGLPNGKFWKFNGQSWSEEKQLAEGVEIFCLLRTQDGSIWAGGSHGSEGTVWRRGPQGWDEGTPLQNATIVYALAEGPDVCFHPP